MGQCLSILSRKHRRDKVRPLEPYESSGSSQENQTTNIHMLAADNMDETAKMFSIVDRTKEMDEDPKVERAGRISLNDHENQVESVENVAKETVDLPLVPEAIDGQEKAEGDAVEAAKDKNMAKETEVGCDGESFSNACRDISGAKSRLIVVRPATDSGFSFASRDPLASRRGSGEASWPNLSQVSSLITRKASCVYHYQRSEGKVGVVKKEWDVESLKRLANTVAKPNECGQNEQSERIVENSRFVKAVISEGDGIGNEDDCEGRDIEKKLEQGHLQWFGLKQEAPTRIDGDGIPNCSDHVVATEEVRKDKSGSKAVVKLPENGSGSHDGGELGDGDNSNDGQNIQSLPSKSDMVETPKLKEKPTKSQTKSMKASYIAHLIVRNQLFGHLDEPAVFTRRWKKERKVSLGIADEDFWLPGQKNPSKDLGTTMEKDGKESEKTPVSGKKKEERKVSLGIPDEDFWLPGQKNPSKDLGTTMEKDGRESEKTPVSGKKKEVSLGTAVETFWLPGQKNSCGNLGTLMGTEGKEKDGKEDETPDTEKVGYRCKQDKEAHDQATVRPKTAKKKTKARDIEFNPQTSSNVPPTSSSAVEEPAKSGSVESTPYWALRDVPSTSWTKPTRFTYESDKADVQTEMKNIESEMAALLKLDEKSVKASLAFTISEGEKDRCQTPAPRRFAMKQKAEVDRVKIFEKQRDAERRRNESIVNRIQSAKRRSPSAEKQKDPLEAKDKCHAKSVKRIGEAIARRDEILTQRIQTAQKSCQPRKDVMKDREFEMTKVKEHVDWKIEAATVRRHEIIDRRVQAAVNGTKLKRDVDQDRLKEMTQGKEQVFEKMEAATSRRKEILNQRVEVAKKASESRGDVVKDRQVKMADMQQNVLEMKLTTFEENRDRMLRRTVRRQLYQERRRELVRKKLARMKHQQEDDLLEFVKLEFETYDGDSDYGENAWDDDDIVDDEENFT